MAKTNKPEYATGLFIQFIAHRPAGVILEAFGRAHIFTGDVLEVRTENGIPFEQAWEMDRSPMWRFCGPNGEDPNPAELEPINDAEKKVVDSTYMGQKAYYPTHTAEDPSYRSATTAAHKAEPGLDSAGEGTLPTPEIQAPPAGLNVRTAQVKAEPELQAGAPE